ncbi:MAG: hypothetical protein WA816_02880 [Bacteroidales bacterium]
MALLAIVTFGIAICTPPVSGPFCKGSCIMYPFADIIARFPGDYIWMYSALLMLAVFLLFIVSIHQYAPDNKKIYAMLGLSFSIASVVVLMSDYFVQISVVQPSLVNGETEGIALLTQYNPHGVFIALEEIGYIMMSIAFISLVPVFSGAGKLKGAIRWIFIISFFLIIITFFLISLKYGIKREYRFEVAAITIDWMALIVSGILIGILFRHEWRDSINLQSALKDLI